MLLVHWIEPCCHRISNSPTRAISNNPDHAADDLPGPTTAGGTKNEIGRKKFLFRLEYININSEKDRRISSSIVDVHGSN
jgi:hypothetical protein